MKKEEVFINLSRCSEEEQKYIFSLLPEPLESGDYDIADYYKFLTTRSGDDNFWIVVSEHDVALWNKTELTCSEFIKLFEGGEEENGGWIKIENEADLPKEETLCWVFRTDKKVVEEMLMPKKGSRTVWWVKTATHYQPIIKPEPPKF